MTFWSLNWFSNFLDGLPLSWLIPFIVPDAIHTAVMGQYVWLWIKKIRRDNVMLEATVEDDFSGQNVLKTILFLFLDTVVTLGTVVGRIFCCLSRKRGKEAKGRNQAMERVGLVRRDELQVI